MKATITFDEEEDLRTALDGYKWKLVAWDLDQEFRRLLKYDCLLYTSPSPRDRTRSRMPSSA